MSAYSCRFVMIAAGLAAALPAAAVGAGERRSVDEHRAADPQGQVEIVNVAGRVEVAGWDKPEVEVSGTLGAAVEKLDIATAGSRTTIRVVMKGSYSGLHLDFGNTGDAKLVVRIPQKSSLNVSLVSADLRVHEVDGNQELQTVSGDVSSDIAREARVRTVSGDVSLTATADARLLEIGTVSGDLHVVGGGGEVTVNTVSGDASLALGATSRARLKTVSGDYHVTVGLAPDGRLEAESISGDIAIQFTGGVPPAEFDLQSFSGNLATCFGGKPVKEGFGPGSRLSFREGAGTARVRVDSKSGDVNLCTKR